MSESKGNYVIKSEIDFKSFKMHIAMTYLMKKEIIAVIIEFTNLIPEHRFNDIYDITNRINTMLMYLQVWENLFLKSLMQILPRL